MPGRAEAGDGLYQAALLFAAGAHSGQVRKGSAVPYVTHPVAVSAILAQYGYGDEVVAAGLLHDVVEDAGVTLATIRERFGDRVASLVEAVSETKSENGVDRPWEVRKQEQIDHLARAPEAVVALKAADSLHNVESILRDLRVRGASVWERFRRPAPVQAALYRRIAGLVEDRLGPAHPLARELLARVAELERVVRGDERGVPGGP